MFKTQQLMRKHLNAFHSEKRFVCDWPGCDYVTHTFNKVGQHKLTHTAKRDLKCGFEGCSKMFSSNQTLDKHRDRHLKRFVCSWPECDERFSEEHSLSAHMNRHLNVRPFKCYINECNKDFTNNICLKQHLRIVHNIRQKDLK